MLTAHLITLDPNDAQLTYFYKACGVARFAYNWALAEWQKQYEEHKKDPTQKKPSETALRRLLNSIKREQFPWMLEVTKNAPQMAIIQLGKAFKNFFSGHAKYPQFRKKGMHDRFTLTNDQFEIKDSRMRLPSLGWVRMREMLRFNGKILSATISRIADRWFVSIAIESHDSPKVKPADSIVGVDLGIATMATLSNGDKITGPKPYKKLFHNLKKLSKALSRKVKGSKNRAKAKTKLARLHARISNIRLDGIHKFTTGLVNRFSTICIEDLSVRSMVKNRRYARSIADMGFKEIARQLEYKLERNGGELIKADRFFPSSKICSNCKYVFNDLTLATRQWTCPICGKSHDRDINAAKNLAAYAVSFDANGTHRYTLTKDYTQSLLSFETDPMGNETHYSYDANQNLTHVRRSDTGVSVEYGYDLRNRLIYTLEKDRMGNQFETQVVYDPAGYKTLEIDRFANETVYVNDSLGRPVQITYPEASDGPKSSIRPTYTYTYGLFDNLLSVTDPKGKLITTSFNSRGKPTAIQHLDGSQELFKYDHEGSLHRYLGRDGLVQVFEYDYIGRLNHIEYYKRGSKGSEEGFKRKYFNYSTFHLTSEQDEKGNKTTYTYDGAGRLATLSKGDQKVEFSYDALGQTQGIKKWKSSNAFTLEVKEYDLLNRVIEKQTQDSQGHMLARSKYIYNEAGQLAQVIGYPQNQEIMLTQYEYDGLGTPCKIIGSSNQVTVIRYDDAYVNEWGQKTRKRTVTDPLGNQTEEIFDNAGHLIKVSKKDKTGHLLAETESSYDLSGNKVLEKAARISSEGRLGAYETEWSFNEGDQLQSVTLGKGTSQERVMTFEYNSYGDLAIRYNPGSKEPITYQYNNYGNLRTISYKEGKKEVSHQLTFDMNRNLTEMRLSSAQVLTYSYDTNDLPLSETIRDEFGSYQVSRSYDGEGNIQTLQLPDGSSVQYNYEGPFHQTYSNLSINRY